MADLVSLVRPLVDAWERGDFRPRPGLVADGLVLTGFTEAGEDRAEGAAEIAAYLRQFFDQWRDYRISVESIAQLGDRHAVIQGRRHGVGRTSGIQIDETVTIVVAVDPARRVTGIHWHMRRDGAMRAAGLGA